MWSIKKIPFILSSITGIVLVLVHAVKRIGQYNEYAGMVKNYYTINNPYSEVQSVFTLWFGSDAFGSYVEIISYIFPFLALLSCSWIFCYEWKKNKSKPLNADVFDRKYFLTRYITTFTMSGATIAVPLIVNFMTVLLFVPAIYPDSIYDIYYGIFSNSFLGNMFYTVPFIYVLVFLILNFIFYGLVGCFCLSISFYIKRWIPSAIITLVGWYGLHFSERLFQVPTLEYSPIRFLIPAKSAYANWFVIVGEAGMMLLFTLILTMLKVKSVSRRIEVEK